MIQFEDIDQLGGLTTKFDSKLADLLQVFGCKKSVQSKPCLDFFVRAGWRNILIPNILQM